MYEAHYGLGRDPFRLTPDPEFRYKHRSYRKAESYMAYGLRRREGLIMVTGAPGLGKTTLVNGTLADLDPDRIVVRSLITTQIGEADFLQMVAHAYGVHAGDTSKSELLRAIEGFLQRQCEAGKHCILLVDEAQALRLSALEELRLLTNLERPSGPLLQVLLLGHDELRDIVRRPELEQLRQRVIAACLLDPLDAAETAEYIRHRLTVAGWTGTPRIAGRGIRLVWRATGGVPRRVNHLMSRLLLHGTLDDLTDLGEQDVSSVIAELRAEGLINAEHGSTTGEQDAGAADELEIALAVRPDRDADGPADEPARAPSSRSEQPVDLGAPSAPTCPPDEACEESGHSLPGHRGETPPPPSGEVASAIAADTEVAAGVAAEDMASPQATRPALVELPVQIPIPVSTDPDATPGDDVGGDAGSDVRADAGGDVDVGVETEPAGEVRAESGVTSVPSLGVISEPDLDPGNEPHFDWPAVGLEVSTEPPPANAELVAPARGRPIEATHHRARRRWPRILALIALGVLIALAIPSDQWRAVAVAVRDLPARPWPQPEVGPTAASVASPTPQTAPAPESATSAEESNRAPAAPDMPAASTPARLQARPEPTANQAAAGTSPDLSAGVSSKGATQEAAPEIAPEIVPGIVPESTSTAASTPAPIADHPGRAAEQPVAREPTGARTLSTIRAFSAATAGSRLGELQRALVRESLSPERVATRTLRVRFSGDDAFANGSADLTTGFLDVLDRLTGVVRGTDVAQVLVVGHSDGVGTEPVNLETSRKRAAAVAGALSVRGVDAATLSVEARGSDEPLDSNLSADGRRRNRRVEVFLTVHEPVQLTATVVAGGFAGGATRLAPPASRHRSARRPTQGLVTEDRPIERAQSPWRTIRDREPWPQNR